jgi:hypothetical protein
VTQDDYGYLTVWSLGGHGRWRIENAAFNVLTQNWHLRHWPIMIRLSIPACLHGFILLNGKFYRYAKITLQKLRLQFYRAFEHRLILPPFSGRAQR